MNIVIDMSVKEMLLYLNRLDHCRREDGLSILEHIYICGVNRKDLLKILDRCKSGRKSEAIWETAFKLEELGYYEAEIIDFLVNKANFKESTVKANLRERKKAAENPSSLPKTWEGGGWRRHYLPKKEVKNESS